MESIVHTEILPINTPTKINIDGPGIKCECTVNTSDYMDLSQSNLLSDSKCNMGGIGNLGWLNIYWNLWFANMCINICCFIILWSLLFRVCKSMPQSCFIAVIILCIISIINSNNLI